jgi:hypothetical protein
MVEPQPSKLVMRVRFPSSAPILPSSCHLLGSLLQILLYAIESRTRCVPRRRCGAARFPDAGVRGSSVILPMSAGQAAVKAFGQHTAGLPRSRLAGGPQGKRTRLGQR